MEKTTTVPVNSHDAIIAIGSSTGGVVVVEQIIKLLPLTLPPIIITQHIPPLFSQSFARRMNDKYILNIYEAAHNQILKSGSVYIAPGDFHLEIMRKNNHYVCQLSQTERVNSHRPSVDVMFDSIVRLNTPNAIGIILTGMGKDGAEGLLHMKQAGLFTIAQNKKSSLIWGMPGEAVKADAACKTLAPENIAQYLINRFSEGRSISSG